MQVTPTLIVDDSLMIQKIIKKALLLNTLDEYKFDEKNIYIASDGMEAFEKMGEHSDIKLIISDVNMPHLSGNEFIEILSDTGKLKDVTVIFVTASSTIMNLSESVKNDILGIIHKPFKYDGFNEQIKQLKHKKEEAAKELNRIIMAQLPHKKAVQNVCEKYIELYELKKDDKHLKELIHENFGDYEVGESDYPDLAYGVLSSYVFDKGLEHNVDNKKILCIIKNFEKKEVVSPNRFGLISGFEERVEHVNTNEMKLRKVLEELTTPLVDKISLALAKANKYPKLNPELYNPYIDFIVKELIEVDCYFEDVELQKLIFEQKEVLEFNQWLLDLLQKNKLVTLVEAVADSEQLQLEIVRRLKLVYKRSVILSHHLAGQIEFTLWKRAKKSLEISQYLKQNMSKSVPCTSRFLLYSGQIDAKQHKQYIPDEQQNLIVLSNDLNKLEKFKKLEEAPYDQWNIFCFSKESLFSSWMKSTGKPSKIVIDYTFSSQVYNNGMQLLKHIVRKYAEVKKLVTFEELYMISNQKNMLEVHKHMDQYKLTIIGDTLEDKEIKDALLYS